MMNRSLIILAGLTLTSVAGTTNIGSSLLEYSGTQGTNGWTYGYYDRTGDAGGIYSGTEFQALPSNGGGGYALGGNPPWTGIFNNIDAHPNSTGNGGEHWVIRRYTVGAGEGGEIELNWLLRKGNVNCGDGVSGYVYHNGTLVDTANVAFNDPAGVFRKAVIPLANPGDTIDLMLSPLSPGNDGCDGSQFFMDLNRRNSYSGLTTTMFADSVTDFGQNTNGWTYGYYNTTLNGPPGPGEFIPFNSSAWNGSTWDLNPAASGPWSEITNAGGHPNGTNSAPGEEHWVTRRYTIQPGEDGDVMAEWNIAKGNPNGGGTSVHILYNGVEVSSTGVEGFDNLGFTGRFAFADTQVGDTIEIALAPQGLDAQLFGAGDNSDGSDSSLFGMKLYSIPEPAVQAAILSVMACFALRRQRPGRDS